MDEAGARLFLERAAIPSKCVIDKKRANSANSKELFGDIIQDLGAST
jgi:hypothetical protein